MPLVTNFYGTGGSFAAPTTADAVSSPVTDAVLPSGAVPYPVTSAMLAANTSPLSGDPNDVLAALTDGGRNLMARELVEGLGFKIIGFRVGRGGYDPLNPLNPLPLIGTDTELNDAFWPDLTLPPRPIDRFEPPNLYGMSMLCRVPAADAIAGLGEIGIYAEITYSPMDPTEVGDQYLFAHCHRPLVGKTLQDVLVWRLVVQY